MASKVASAVIEKALSIESLNSNRKMTFRCLDVAK